MSVLALIPARAGSKSIPRKNFRELGGLTLVEHAVRAAQGAGIRDIMISCDEFAHLTPRLTIGWRDSWRDVDAICLPRPLSLAQDETPMIEVVKHALTQIPGPEEQVILLLQPTQPFRTPDHLRQAITRLQESGADSVVSVVELPRTHHPRLQAIVLQNERLMPYEEWDGAGWSGLPARRQDVSTTYIRDGTCYAFRRSTVSRYGSIYGQDVRPLIIPPEQSCELDTEADWERVEARWTQRG